MISHVLLLDSEHRIMSISVLILINYVWVQSVVLVSADCNNVIICEYCKCIIIYDCTETGFAFTSFRHPFSRIHIIPIVSLSRGTATRVQINFCPFGHSTTLTSPPLTKFNGDSESTHVYRYYNMYT